MSYAATVLDLDDAGYSLLEDGRPAYHSEGIYELTDDDFDFQFVKKQGKAFGPTIFEKHFQDGDLIVIYDTMRDGVPLSGAKGYLLVRNRRVVAKRWTMMS